VNFLVAIILYSDLNIYKFEENYIQILCIALARLGTILPVIREITLI